MPENLDRQHSHGPASVGGWLAPVLVILFTILWSLTIYALIGWRSRDWQYGAVPYIPAESVFTTRSYPAGQAPRQVILPAPVRGGQDAKR